MPPPDHNAATSAPLFVEDLPVGTVSVRITHPSMTEPIAGVNVVGAWTTKDGKQKSATLKTGDDGRAIFKDIPAGSTFGAKTTVEGENLATAQFTVPDQGGTRLLVMVGAQAAEAMNEMTGERGGRQACLPNRRPGRAFGQGRSARRHESRHP
jgi:hypothetical protein